MISQSACGSRGLSNRFLGLFNLKDRVPDRETEESKYQSLEQSDLEADFQPIQRAHERRVYIWAQRTGDM
jgi:hypothetical protein